MVNVSPEYSLKDGTLFSDCISEINNTKADNVKDPDIVIPIYNLIDYNNNYSKTSGNLW